MLKLTSLKIVLELNEFNKKALLSLGMLIALQLSHQITFCLTRTHVRKLIEQEKIFSRFEGLKISAFR